MKVTADDAATPLTDAVVLITGAGSGIGAALARRAARDGARAVIVADRDRPSAEAVASAIGAQAIARHLDVTDDAAIGQLRDDTIARFDRVDAVFSNAGLTSGVGVLGGDDAGTADLWRTAWAVNVHAHVQLARVFLPSMISAGGGRFVVTASAAGLLTSPGDCPYAVTKHAAVAFAEWLAIHHAQDGIAVSVVCPLGVATPLLHSPLSTGQTMEAVVRQSGDVLSPDDVADAVVQAMADGKFLVLPHPQVGDYLAQKAADPDRWVARMQRFA